MTTKIDVKKALIVGAREFVAIVKPVMKETNATDFNFSPEVSHTRTGEVYKVSFHIEKIT